MKKVLLFMIAFMVVSCATVEFNSENIVKVTDEKGNSYSCEVGQATEDKAFSIGCKFRVQIKDAIFACEVDFKKSLKFEFSESCVLDILLKENKVKEDQTMILPTTIKDSKRESFYNRTIAKIIKIHNHLKSF